MLRGWTVDKEAARGEEMLVGQLNCSWSGGSKSESLKLSKTINVQDVVLVKLV